VNKLQQSIILFVAQGAYSGRSPFAPGTAGTIIGMLLYLFFKERPLWIYLGVCAVVTALGSWAAGEAEKLLGKKDSPSIVIDEIAGFLVSMLLVPGTWQFMIAGFLLFRFFDIVKPWPLHGLQKVRGGMGVMLDDLGAGIYTNIILHIGHWVAG